MVSEINNSPPAPIAGIEHGTPQVRPSEKAAAPAASANISAESVTLTDQASRVGELVKAVEDVPVTDAQKVSHFREAVESGNYQVNAEAVAEKFNAIEQILNAPAAKK